MDALRVLVVVAFVGLLVLLRLDAARFGAAEYDDETAPGGWRNAARRGAWYALGLTLAAAIWLIHPLPVSVLHLHLGGDRLGAILAGLTLGALGTAVAVLFAQARYRRLRFPEPRLYPGAMLNSIGTAVIDEVAFRGALLGLLIAAGVPADAAIALQAVLYGLATRLGAPGRSRVMLAVFLGLGLVTGAVTLATGGIGAAVLGHAITRMAFFVCTGHPGQVLPLGHEPEEEEAERLPPEGWQVVPEGDR
ncbi:MAG TPA: CPBP family intramembrane glutamic endopeptidase [Candidatus Limnocylindrales bacterium]|nr:CPBP family intramembrane glutamic endopeptidase [Candidatus Limnocylindrales bacterium]